MTEATHPGGLRRCAARLTRPAAAGELRAMNDARPAPRVPAVVPDLFFAAKIEAVAKAAGAALAFAAPAEAPARCAADPPDFVLVDLHAGPGVHAMLRALAADPATRGVPTIGFFSPVDLAARDAAIAAGLDRALPRSAFVARLPALLAAPDPAGPPPGGG